MSSGTKVNGPTALLRKTAALESGTTKDVPAKSTMTVAGAVMTQAQILSNLQAGDQSYAKVTAARLALTQALAAWKTAEAALRTFVTEYVATLKAQFGAGNPILTDFGINPRKPAAKRTAAQKVISAALAAETKAARGSNKGRKQKQAITAQGTPGLVMVSPSGQPIASTAVQGPTPPGASEPVDVAGSLTAGAGSNESGGTPSGSGSK
ncbi:MAG: hypothetical protein ACYDCL_06145 [Myxococcales bacterium]